jgi:hypothetical protein
MKFLLLISATIFLMSCSTKEQNVNATNGGTVLTFNDFESLAGWAPENNTLTRENAHSGQYSIKVDPDKEFSLGYDMQLGNITPRKPRKVRLEAQAYLFSGQSQAKLGLQISDPANGQMVLGDGIQLAEQVTKYRTWTPVSKEIEIPDNVVYSHHIKVFLWRGYFPETAYVDDIKLSLVD